VLEYGSIGVLGFECITPLLHHSSTPVFEWATTAYGKGVAYHEINGRGVVYIASPGFFLYALDAETGKPLVEMVLDKAAQKGPATYNLLKAMMEHGTETNITATVAAAS